MKIKITKILGRQDDDLIGTVHLEGFIDSTACGLADEDFEWKEVKRGKITCSLCKDALRWAKEASKIKE